MPDPLGENWGTLFAARSPSVSAGPPDPQNENAAPSAKGSGENLTEALGTAETYISAHDEESGNFGHFLPNVCDWPEIEFAGFDWLRRSGVSVETFIRLMPLRQANGFIASDGRFDIDPGGRVFLVFEEAEDLVFWQPRTGELATWDGRAFALGESAIGNPGTYSLGGHLMIHAGPLSWLRSDCDGCVVLDWSRAFDRLRHCPRIAIAEPLLATYRKAMTPILPKVAVLAGKAAA